MSQSVRIINRLFISAFVCIIKGATSGTWFSKLTIFLEEMFYTRAQTLACKTCVNFSAFIYFVTRCALTSAWLGYLHNWTCQSVHSLVEHIHVPTFWNSSSCCGTGLIIQSFFFTLMDSIIKKQKTVTRLGSNNVERLEPVCCWWECRQPSSCGQQFQLLLKKLNIKSLWVHFWAHTQNNWKQEFKQIHIIHSSIFYNSIAAEGTQKMKHSDVRLVDEWMVKCSIYM